MKVAIYDTVHLDWIIPYAELLAEEDMTITFITSAAFKNDLENIVTQKNSRYRWYFTNPNAGLIESSKKLYSVLKNNRYDLLILNSLDSRHLLIFLNLVLFKPKRILVNLHDVNNFFKIKPALSIRKNIRSIGKKLIMSLTDGYIVNAEAMKAYITENSFTRKPTYWLQPVYYKPTIPGKKVNFDKTIVIPGTIDLRRRNYDLVLEVIQEMLNQEVLVKWVFAGKPVGNYGADIIKKAKELDTHGAHISLYKEEIPENEFQQIIATSSLILSPLVASTSIHDNIREVYGRSKGSGNVYDAIRHAKPLIVPSTVFVPKEIVTSCVFYKSKDNLVQQLLSILSDDSLLGNYRQKAERNSKNFPKERIVNMFKAVFRGVS